MKITLIAVGKIKEKYLKDAIGEYTKRLSKYAKIEIIEVADEKCGENLSPKEQEIVKDKEGERILSKIGSGLVVPLEISGKKFTSEGFADFIKDTGTRGISNIIFIIGGSLGLSDKVLQKKDIGISFSEMTFPHQLMRVILLEQVYRGFRINGNEPYHK